MTTSTALPDLSGILEASLIRSDITTPTALPDLSSLNVDTYIIRRTMSEDDLYSQEATVRDNITRTSQNRSITDIDIFPKNSDIISESEAGHELPDPLITNNIGVTVTHTVGRCELALTPTSESANEPHINTVPIIIDRIDTAEDVTDVIKVDNVSKIMHLTIIHESSIVMERNNMGFSSGANLTKSAVFDSCYHDTGQN